MVNKQKSIKLTQKEKILKYLIENKNPQSIKNISGATLLDYKNTYNIISDIPSGIIYQNKIGNTNLVNLNLVPNQDIYSVENKRTEEFLDEMIRIVKEIVEGN